MSPTSAQANILIVDDKPDKLLALESVLTGLGENIVCATSGRDALRHVLSTDFAVILLDVNMPGMDGFETAAMIRQRPSSRHVPIIFITALADEMHVVHGYSLGAVDYILAPVVPEVLYSKVSVFVDLYRKTQQVRQQAESLGRRALQLQKLAQASIAVNSEISIDNMLQAVTDAALDILDSHQAVAVFLDPRPGRVAGPRTFVALTERHERWRGRRVQIDALLQSTMLHDQRATRLTAEQLSAHPQGSLFAQIDAPPVGGGIVAAPLTSRAGQRIGFVYAADPIEGHYTSDDEAVAVHVAQMASIAIENALFDEEREANRLKEEFLSTLSHELRTPLNAILGWTQLMRMDPTGTEVGHGIEVIERNAKAQARLIEDLLDVSRIATGKLRLNTTRLAIEPLVRDVCDSSRPAADAKKITMTVAASENCCFVEGDADRLRQVLTNLLTNAIKFTPPGGCVSVSVGADGAFSQIQVTDNGCGIDATFLPFVFERFLQFDSSSTRRQGGLGIGLSIVRHIVQLHGGSVAAYSGGTGRGSTFTIKLPLTVAATQEPPSTDLRAHSGRDRGIGGKRVLLLDDQSDVRDMLKRILQRAHAEVRTTSSVREALEVIPQFRPDVVLSDIAMPDEDGYAFIRQLRQKPENLGGATPAIAMTAYAREEDRLAAVAHGFQSHVAKPIEPDELIEEIVRVMNGQVPQAMIA